MAIILIGKQTCSLISEYYFLNSHIMLTFFLLYKYMQVFLFVTFVNITMRITVFF